MRAGRGDRERGRSGTGFPLVDRGYRRRMTDRRRVDEEVVYEGDRCLARRRYRGGGAHSEGDEASYDIIPDGPSTPVLAFTDVGGAARWPNPMPSPGRTWRSASCPSPTSAASCGPGT
jgi:hypothetical protein